MVYKQEIDGYWKTLAEMPERFDSTSTAEASQTKQTRHTSNICFLPELQQRRAFQKKNMAWTSKLELNRSGCSDSTSATSFDFFFPALPSKREAQSVNY